MGRGVTVQIYEMELKDNSIKIAFLLATITLNKNPSRLRQDIGFHRQIK